MIKNRFLNIFETSSLFCQLWEGDFLPGSSLGFLIPAGLFLSSPCWEPFISGAHIEMAGWNSGSRNCVAEEDFSHFQVFSASLETLRHNILAQPTVVQQQLGLKGLRVALGLVSHLYLSLLFDLKVWACARSPSLDWANPHALGCFEEVKPCFLSAFPIRSLCKGVFFLGVLYVRADSELNSSLEIVPVSCLIGGNKKQYAVYTLAKSLGLEEILQESFFS